MPSPPIGTLSPTLLEGARQEWCRQSPAMPAHNRTKSSYPANVQSEIFRVLRSAGFVGARQKGDSKWEKPVSAKICGFLRESAVSCGFLCQSATPKSLDLQSEPKISENLQKCAFRVRFLPFAVSLLAHPEFGCPKLGCTPKGAYSPRRHSRHLLEAAFSEPFSEPFLL